MTGPFKRLLRELRETRRRRRDKAAVDVSDDGFVYTCRRVPASVKWDEVTALAAGTYAISSGEVFFMRVGAGATELQIDEFADGFSNFERALVERYPFIRDKINTLQTTTSRHDRLVELWAAP